ncbi:pyridoxamine 5'-phosphate oxidase [Oleomonas cavernae]|uniref:Pyridoxine/pyridoxamine 5'-phosphate oxidase n=1 Tax=Oleomonas cavernae TaxID=2320859 RepID=A0A418WUF5_9PROT|nr:pyridoxamine 5'-phosphate oxidase [Oleomonas cavernae]RJF94875.1 pyridoxamine 5'-phosphate oxidase [Oleomonas cavernae]
MSDLLSSSSDAILAQRGPYALFAAWFAEAEAAEPNDANAMSVATTTAGRPSVRILLMKGYDSRGFVFYTNFESRKGLELLENPYAAIDFHWKSLKRQVRAEGVISVVSDAEADAYFASRPRDSQIGAWASAQSRPLDARATFDQAVAEVSARFEGGPVPRPPHWSGFRLTPSVMEFWQDRAFRLHDRVVFTPAGGDVWKVHRLYP